MRYRIVGDNSGHSYYVPVDKQAEWDTLWKGIIYMTTPKGTSGTTE